MIKKITDYIPIFAFLIIVLGLCKQFIYYSNFNLPINNFLGLSEIGIIISDDLITNVPFIIIWIVFLTSIDFYIKNKLDPIVNTKKNEPTSAFSIKKEDRKSKWSNIWVILIITLFFFGLLFIIFLIENIPEYYEQISWTIFTWGFSVIVICLVVLFTNTFRKLIPKEIIYIMFILTSIFMKLGLSSTKEISNVKHGKFTGTIIQTDKGDFVSDSLNYYIGKTEKHVFYYYSKEKQTRIIPSDKVTTLILKSK